MLGLILITIAFAFGLILVLMGRFVYTLDKGTPDEANAIETKEWSNALGGAIIFVSVLCFMAYCF